MAWTPAARRRPPQPRHQRLQGVRRVDWQARLLPEQVDQPLGCHYPPRLQRQHGNQEPQPPAGQLDHAALALDLERSQQADLHLAVTLPLAPLDRSTPTAVRPAMDGQLTSLAGTSPWM